MAAGPKVFASFSKKKSFSLQYKFRATADGLARMGANWLRF
jgi:hypothetical protein